MWNRSWSSFDTMKLMVLILPSQLAREKEYLQSCNQMDIVGGNFILFFILFFLTYPPAFYLGNCRLKAGLARGIDVPSSVTHHLTITTRYHSPQEMAHSSNSSNVFVHGTLNSVQGDFHIHNNDSESGGHDFHLERASLSMTK